MNFLRKLVAQPILVLAAACFGVFVVVADGVLFGTMLGRAADFSEPDVLVFRGLLVAAPFIWLAYRGSTHLLPWLMGIALTLWLGWRWLLNGVAYQRAPDGSGVPMGFALLMVFSPLFIGFACALLDESIRELHLIRGDQLANPTPSSLVAALRAPGSAIQKWLSAAASAWRRY